MRFSRRIWSLYVALALVAGVTTSAQGDVTTQAAREAAEFVLKKFGKEAGEEGVEKLSIRLESLAAKHGDEALNAVRKVGPRALRAVEEAGEQGPAVARLLAREGDRALWVAENPSRLALFASQGDEAASAMLKHKGVADSLVAKFKAPAAKALTAMDGRNARRLAQMAEGGELAAIGRTDELLAVVGRYGDKAMNFIWRNKLVLTGGTALAAFLADPEPFIDGAKDLTEVVTREVIAPVADKVATGVVDRVDWTWFFVVLAGIVGAYAAWRTWLRHRRLRAAGQG